MRRLLAGMLGDIQLIHIVVSYGLGLTVYTSRENTGKGLTIPSMANIG